MKPSDFGLADTQRWVQDFIVAANPTIPQAQADELVLPSASLDARERVGIYRDMYLSRLGEALESDYPALLHYLGRDEFDRLVARYVQIYPSRSYTLNRLGDHLPAFLAVADDFPARDFLCDLARLELAVSQVFDAPESPVLTGEAIAAVPPEAWETARLQPIEALQLLSLQYPASEYLGAVDGENPMPAIRKRKNWTAIFRREYGVHRLDLKRQAFELLTALVSGAAVGEAVKLSNARPKQLFGWFREWTSEGLFERVIY